MLEIVTEPITCLIPGLSKFVKCKVWRSFLSSPLTGLCSSPNYSPHMPLAPTLNAPVAGGASFLQP